MRSYRLPGPWFYENVVTDCLCSIVTAGLNPLVIGKELYCETHRRIALVIRIVPAQEVETDELVTMDIELTQVDAE